MYLQREFPQIVGMIKSFFGLAMVALLVACSSSSSGEGGGAKQGLGVCQAGYDHLFESCDAADADDWADWCEEKGFPDLSDEPCSAERQALTDCNRNGVVACGMVDAPGFRIECTDAFNALLSCESP